MSLLMKTFCDGSKLYLTVEIGLVTSGSSTGIWNTAVWDTSLWGFSTTWTDVSAWVMKFSTSGNFSRDIRIWSSASATVELNNRDGRFSAENLLGPYVTAGLSSIRPGCGVRAKLTYGGVDYWLFTGRVDEWSDGVEEARGPRTGVATTTVTCSDEWSNLAGVPGVQISPSVGASDSFGARISRLLNVSGSTSPRNIDVGTSTMQATDLSDDPIQAIELTCDSEGGAAYIAPDGTIVAKRKYGLVEDTRSTVVQATFGDGGGSEIPWTKLDRSPLNLTNVINLAAYTRVGGIQQVFGDIVSRSLYGDRGDKSSNIGQLICETDAQALSLAQWAVLAHKDPETPIDGLSVDPQCDPSLMPTIFGLQLRDLVRVLRRPPSATSHVVDRYCFVSGIAVSVEKGVLDYGFSLASATKYRDFAASRWDTGLWDSALWFI